MSTKEMYDYISAGTADYTGATLNISHVNILTELGEFNQKIFWHDDKSLRVVPFSPATIQFFVEFDFQYLTEEEAGTLLDLYANSSKAYGSMRSFYWEHPVDGHTYILRFLTPFNRSISSDIYGRMSIQALKCIVESFIAVPSSSPSASPSVSISSSPSVSISSSPSSSVSSSPSVSASSSPSASPSSSVSDSPSTSVSSSISVSISASASEPPGPSPSVSPSSSPSVTPSASISSSPSTSISSSPSVTPSASISSSPSTSISSSPSVTPSSSPSEALQADEWQAQFVSSSPSVSVSSSPSVSVSSSPSVSVSNSPSISVSASPS